eukprot:Rhum_TRINITY_DN13412_c0_g1::Rhum_TRINITY_DN13412_c0_g1_i1::g.60048::m.60048
MSRHLQGLLAQNIGVHSQTLTGIVVDRWKLRQREYSEGVVFNVSLRNADVARGSQAAVAMLYFRGDQAEACSFLEPGDRVSVDSFVVESNPAVDSAGPGAPPRCPLVDAQRVFVCGPAATITVCSLQDGAPLELTLRHGLYDQPEARLASTKRSEDARANIFCNAGRGMGQALPEAVV